MDFDEKCEEHKNDRSHADSRSRTRETDLSVSSQSTLVPEEKQGTSTSVFPYSGIFTSGGFLSSNSNSTAEDEGQNNQNQSEKKSNNSPRNEISSSSSSTTCSPKSKRIKLQTWTNAGLTNALVDSDSDLSHGEQVASVDHILEFILSLLDEETLLSSRLVCRRWSFFASKELQNLITVQFWQPRCPGMEESPGGFIHKQTGWYLEDFMRVLNNGQLFGFDFPCNSYNFYDADTLSPGAQTFFNTYGTSIKKLNLIGCEIFFEDVKRLLLLQAPNLNHLALNGTLSTETSSWDLNSIGRSHILGLPGPETKVSIFTTRTENESPAKLNLKFIQCTRKIPEDLLDQLISCSPSLVEVEVQHENLDYLVRPVNRLHLLKCLRVSSQYESMKALEILAHNHEGKLGLREFNLNYLHGLVKDENAWARVVSILTRILEGCSGTCEKLVWYQLRFLEGLQIPVMPKVKHITFIYYTAYGSRHSRTSQFFSPYINMNVTFPNLKSVFIRIRRYFMDEPISNLFVGENSGPVLSVRRVSVRLFQNARLLASFREMFPNAAFQFVDVEN